MQLLSDELWNEIKPVFSRAFPREAIVAIWPNGEWRELANAGATPTQEFRLTHEDHASLLKRKPALFLHSHPNGSPEPSDLDSLNQLATGWTWGIVCVTGNAAGQVYDVAYPEIWGPDAPVLPYEGRQYLWGVRDCVTLVTDFYARDRGVQLERVPRLRNPNPLDGKQADPFRHWPAKMGFKPIERHERRPGDLAVMFWNSPVANHCAVYLGEGSYLHQLINRCSEKWMPKDEETVLERYAVQFWRLKAK